MEKKTSPSSRQSRVPTSLQSNQFAIMAGEEGILHLLVHLLYFCQYSALGLGVIIAFFYFQRKSYQASNNYHGLASLPSFIFLILFTYDVIQIVRSQMSIFHTRWSDTISAFLYYWKDGYSVTLLLVILYIWTVNLVDEDKRKTIGILLTAVALLVHFACISFSFIRLFTLGLDDEIEYVQGMLIYDFFYFCVIFAIFIAFLVVSILLYKKRPTTRLAVGSIILIEILVLCLIHRFTYMVASFGISDVLFEFVIFLYRFFGFGINLWVLVFFWGKSDIYDDGVDEIDNTINSEEVAQTTEISGGTFEQI